MPREQKKDETKSKSGTPARRGDPREYKPKAMGEKKGGKGNIRKNREQRKKGQPSWKNVEQEVKQLNMRILQETPPSGVHYFKYKPNKANEEEDEKKDKDFDISQPKGKRRHHPILETPDKTKIKIRFNDLPLSRCTMNGLNKSKFIKMTEVQRSSILHALNGRDIVCSARTGSGKTLSYLIPVVEALYRARWT